MPAFGSRLIRRLNIPKPQHPTIHRVLRSGYTAQEVRSAMWYILVAWIFGAIFFSITTGATLTSFLTKYLHADDLSYGLILAAVPAAVLFQLIGSYVVESTGHTKRNFLIFVTAHRLLWLGVAAIPLVMPNTPAKYQIGLVGIIAFVAASAANFGSAGWAAWMSRIVPRSIAGKYFGIRSRAGMIAMIVSTTLAAYLLDRFHEQGWLYAAIFGVASICGAMDILLFIPVREVPKATEEKRPSMLELLAIPWKDRLFRGYTFYTAFSWVAYMMAGAFIWRYCFESKADGGLGMSITQANLMLFILPVLGMAWVAPFWGRAIDRYGPKPVLVASSLYSIIIPSVWVFMHQDLMWIIPIIALLGGLTWPGIEQVMLHMQFNGFPDARRTAYTATFQVVFGLATMLGTSLGGVYAAFWQGHMEFLPALPVWVTNYHLVFATSIVLRIVAFVFMLLPLPMPGKSEHRHVTREVAQQTVSSIPGVRHLRKRWSEYPPRRNSQRDEP